MKLFLHFLLWWIVILIVGAYIANSWKLVPPGYIGARFVFGKEWGKKGVGPGLRFVPFLICSIRLESSKTHEIEIPGDAEVVQKKDQDVIKYGMKAPIRVVYNQAETAIYREYDEPTGTWIIKKWEDFSEDERKVMLTDPLNQRITGEDSVVLRWRITKETIFEFIRNSRTISHVNGQLTDTATSVLRDEHSKVTMANAMVTRQYANEVMFRKILALVGPMSPVPWGIDFLSAQLNDIDPGETVNRSMANAAASFKNKEETINNAQADKAKSMAETDAEAYKEKEMGTAKAAAIEAVGAAMEKPGAQLAAQLETAASVFKEAKHTIITGDMAGVIGSVTKVMEVVKAS